MKLKDIERLLQGAKDAGIYDIEIKSGDDFLRVRMARPIEEQVHDIAAPQPEQTPAMTEKEVQQVFQTPFDDVLANPDKVKFFHSDYYDTLLAKEEEHKKILDGNTND